MTVAILVLGFREPKVLAVAATVYKNAGCDVFVHVDAKTSLEDYLALMGPISAECTFLENRIDISWAGYSMIDATFSLIRAAASRGNYTNIALVSDDTMPLMDGEALHRYLKYDLDRISLRRLDSSDPFFLRYKRFYCFDHIATSLFGRSIESSHIDGEFLDKIHRLEILKNKGKAELDVFYGSQWWCLTRSSIESLINLHEHDSWIRESFEFSAVPDEMYIHSIIGRNLLQNRVVNGPVFVDWSRSPRPYVFKAINEVSHIDTGDWCFVRKCSREFAQSYASSRFRKSTG